MENPKGAHKGGKKKPAGGDVQKQCAECEQSKPRDAFSKTQWARDERKCAECIAKGKAEGHETEKILEVVPDEVVELTSEGIDDFVARASQMLETLELQPDQACSDRGRPGTCSSLEYCQVKTTVRLSLHPHLYLRSMSYVGHYQREGVSFATPSIVVQVNELKRVPAAIVALLKPNEDKIVSSLRVWTFRGCPKTINIMSHGFVFEGQDAVKGSEFRKGGLILFFFFETGESS